MLVLLFVWMRKIVSCLLSLSFTTLYSCAHRGIIYDVIALTCMSLSFLIRFDMLKNTGLNLDINTPASKWNCHLPLPRNIPLTPSPDGVSNTCYLSHVCARACIITWILLSPVTSGTHDLDVKQREIKPEVRPYILLRPPMVAIWIIDLRFFSSYLLSEATRLTRVPSDNLWNESMWCEGRYWKRFNLLFAINLGL